MTLHQTIKNHTKESMLAKDETRTMVLRGVQAEIQRELLAKKLPAGTPAPTEATDDEALAVVKRLVKQRKDSIDQFTKGGRADLAENEQKELGILQRYLPAAMPREEIRKVVDAKRAELGVTDKSGAGKLIGAVSKELKGKAEGADIKAVVDEALG
ncbi:MAG: GatB/YqeY domain-containing protein [Patescibacteria group bacterium]|nr:GatB/YqeY domain-containing protein [Patescibacteria group bacterium]